MTPEELAADEAAAAAARLFLKIVSRLPFACGVLLGAPLVVGLA